MAPRGNLCLAQDIPTQGAAEGDWVHWTGRADPVFQLRPRATLSGVWDQGLRRFSCGAPSSRAGSATLGGQTLTMSPCGASPLQGPGSCCGLRLRKAHRGSFLPKEKGVVPQLAPHPTAVPCPDHCRALHPGLNHNRSGSRPAPACALCVLPLLLATATQIHR